MKTLLSICIFVFAATSSFAQVELTETEFKKLHSELEPKGEAWKTIPWHSELLTAQRQAVRQQKPLFIWAMDGHPLGCV